MLLPSPSVSLPSGEMNTLSGSIGSAAVTAPTVNEIKITSDKSIIIFFIFSPPFVHYLK